MMNNRAWRWLMPIIAFISLSIPAWIFFSQRGGTAFLTGRDPQTFATLIFPLIGLYAFTLVWMQIMLGSLMPLWQRWWPKLFYYHRAQGVFALLFALTHPLLLWFGIGTPSYFRRDFVAPENVPYVYLGYVAVFSIILTVCTALLMRTAVVKKFWRKLHYLNYVVFFSAGVHSYMLGSDIQSTGLRYVWICYAATVCTAIILRLSVFKRPARSTPTVTESSVQTPSV